MVLPHILEIFRNIYFSIRSTLKVYLIVFVIMTHSNPSKMLYPNLNNLLCSILLKRKLCTYHCAYLLIMFMYCSIYLNHLGN